VRCSTRTRAGAFPSPALRVGHASDARSAPRRRRRRRAVARARRAAAQRTCVTHGRQRRSAPGRAAPKHEEPRGQGSARRAVPRHSVTSAVGGARQRRGPGLPGDLHARSAGAPADRSPSGGWRQPGRARRHHVTRGAHATCEHFEVTAARQRRLTQCCSARVDMRYSSRSPAGRRALLARASLGGACVRRCRHTLLRLHAACGACA
jgi:hypothetical protein